MVCPICLEKIDSSNEEVLVTDCKHRFHKNCLIKWYNINDKCPYCRQIMCFDIISDFTEDMFPEFTYKKYNRKTAVINGIYTSFIEKNLKYTFIRQVSWLNSKSNTHTRRSFVLTPLYSFPYYNNTILITAYTRLVLLYNNDYNISIIPKKDINQLEYYKTETESVYITEKVFLILFEWIFDVLDV